MALIRYFDPTSDLFTACTNTMCAKIHLDSYKAERLVYISTVGHMDCSSLIPLLKLI